MIKSCSKLIYLKNLKIKEELIFCEKNIVSIIIFILVT